MGHESRREFFSAPLSGYLSPEHIPQPRHHCEETDLKWPFGKLDGLDYDEIRETAYEIFFTACRSSPGFGGRNSLAYYSTSSYEDNEFDEPRTNSFSRVKRALGLKMLKRSQSKPIGNWSGFEGAPAHVAIDGCPPQFLKSSSSSKRPLTCAEIMRQQMGVTEQSDNRLRKTLMRTLVGQMGRRTETIILPLELLRNLKASEFDDSYKYHIWQKRQLKVLQLGVLQYPYIPIDNNSNPFVISLKKIIQSAEIEIMDTGKNSDTMRNLCNSVLSLCWRTNGNVSPGDVCHWVDGYPVNVNLYVALLEAIFDTRDDTSVVDEVDELLELMKKTWSTLGIDKSIHNVCLTWVFFNQYVLTSQLEPDLLCASHAILTRVAGDAKMMNNQNMVFHKVMSSVLNSILVWSEKRLLSYHEYFQKGTISLLENLLPLVLTSLKIIQELDQEKADDDTRSRNNTSSPNSPGQHIDNYIRSSLKTALKKVIEFHGFDRTMELKQEVSEAILQLAKEVEELALNEKEWFSPILKKWHPMSLGVAAVTLHGCYGIVLKHYLECTSSSSLSNETVQVLQRAEKLENFLVQMVVEDSADCEDGGKSIVREMDPYEVDTVIIGLLKQWIADRLKKGKDYVERAKEVETWNPKSKSEPYAQSVVEVMKLAKETINEFFEFSFSITEDLVLHLTDALGQIFMDYINALVNSCGSKQSYMPVLPPLTRCQQDSTFIKLCKIATPCTVSAEVPAHQLMSSNKQGVGHQPRPSTSRGTQRLYIRLNTLHYLLTYIYSLEKSLAISRRNTSYTSTHAAKLTTTTINSSLSSSSTYFEAARSSVLTACQAVSEVAAYRLIFLDSSVALYDTLYVGGDVSSARIQPALRILKQNLTLLCAILTERAQPLAIKELIKACFEAFLRVLLAGGSSRMFYRSDHDIIAQDFTSLKRMFSTCGEGLMNDDAIEKELDVVHGVIALMGETTEELIADFNAASGSQPQSSTSSDSEDSSNTTSNTHLRKKLPIPPTTGKWSRSDPNTILRVLCHRVDRTANHFLKRSFQLSKRK